MINFRELFARMMGMEGKRDLWKTFGYPVDISLQQYWLRYKRDGIGRRVIRSYPEACWRQPPLIFDNAGVSDDPNDKDYSPFVEAAGNFFEHTGAFRYLSRADVLSRTGHYAILLLGFDDDAELSEPMDGEANLVYLATYSEHSAKITKWEEDRKSPRYGFPVTYSVTPRNDDGASGSKQSFTVHHTRVIHIAEGADEDEIFGTPALRPIWNYLLDLEKVVGSGSETFWLNARGGMSIEVAPDAQLTDTAREAMKTQVDEFENELRRVFALQGASAKPLLMQVNDPSPNANLILQLISGETGIPNRLLLGSERGELASSQDASSWEARVDERNRHHCEPNILIPFIDRMIETGNLPEPEEQWFAEWPEASAMTPDKQADVAIKRMTAANIWASGFADRAITRSEFRQSIGYNAEPEGGELPDDEDGDEGDDSGFDDTGGDNA